MKETYREKDVLKVLRTTLAEAKEAGIGQNAWAEANGLQPAYVSAVVNGRLPLRSLLLAVLGFEPVAQPAKYRRI